MKHLVWRRKQLVGVNVATSGISSLSSHLHVLFDLFLLISELSERIDDQTCDHKRKEITHPRSTGWVLELQLTLDDSQEDDDDEEEKGDVEKDAVELVGVTGRVLDLVPYASPCPHPDVHVEEVTLRAERGGQR